MSRARRRGRRGQGGRADAEAVSAHVAEAAGASAAKGAPGACTAAFDWGGLMRAGLFGLGLDPRTFWALTPVELLMMLGMEGGSAPLSRARLEELAARFPDKVKGTDDGGIRGLGGADRGAGGIPFGGAGDDGGL